MAVLPRLLPGLRADPGSDSSRTHQGDVVDQAAREPPPWLPIFLPSRKRSWIFLGRIFVAEPLRVVVVEVLVRAPPCRRCRAPAVILTGMRHFSRSSPMMVVTKGAISKSSSLLPPPAFAKPGVQRLLEEVEALGVHPDRESRRPRPRRALHSLGRDRGGVDLQRRITVQDALERLAQPRGILRPA